MTTTQKPTADLVGSPQHRTSVTTGWYSPDDCRLDDLRALVEVDTDPERYPHADEVVSRVLVYGERWRAAATTPTGRRALQAELADALLWDPLESTCRHASLSIL